MIQLAKVTQSIKQDINSVFTYTTDLENYSNWFEGIIHIEPSNTLAQLEIGKTYRETLLINDKEEILTIKVHHCSSPTQFVTQGDLVGLLPQMTMSFEQISEQETRFTLVYASREPALKQNPEMIQALQDDLHSRANKAVQNLKKILEER
ncbi:SRPBCC family protein [Marinomonas sp. PE14-40]|uniref:SRPBCC family protein n=1 Tax=Marinomonas sp. PE14-40 TaxID=3060621 RepID=UPI003F6629FD